MNRALPFLLIAAAAAGGLGYFALQTSDEPLSVDDDIAAPEISDETRAKPKTAEPVHLAVPTQAAPKTKRRDTDGTAKSLEIIPMNALGQPLPDAQVVATQGSEELTGTGRIKWDSVPAGEWTVTVEAPDAPKWVRTLTIGNGERRREAAHVCDELRIEGKVVDAYGEPQAKTPLFFLPSGVSHPGRSDLAPGKARTSRDNQWKTTTGAIPATTSAGGSFSVRLPKPGKWRVSVGHPDRPTWTQPQPTDLTVGGPNIVRVVVPAKSQLTLTLPEDLRSKENRPSQVSAYVFDADHAALVERQRQDSEMQSGKEADIQKEQKRLVQEERRKLEEGGADDGGKYADGEGADKTGRGGGRGRGRGRGRDGDTRAERKQAMEENARLGRERRGGGVDYRPVANAPLFDPGWRSVGTARFDQNGVATLEGLPGNEDIRFLFTRGRERLTTSGSARIEPGKRSVATVQLPPPVPSSDENTRSDNAMVRTELDTQQESESFKESVEWTVD